MRHIKSANYRKISSIICTCLINITYLLTYNCNLKLQRKKLCNHKQEQDNNIDIDIIEIIVYYHGYKITTTEADVYHSNWYSEIYFYCIYFCLNFRNVIAEIAVPTAGVLSAVALVVILLCIVKRWRSKNSYNISVP